MSATDGNELYVWQAQEASGEWSMIGVVIPDPVSGIPLHTPLIHRKRDVVLEMRELAERHAIATGQPLRLARLTLTEVLEGGGR